MKKAVGVWWWQSQATNEFDNYGCTQATLFPNDSRKLWSICASGGGLEYLPVERISAHRRQYFVGEKGTVQMSPCAPHLPTYLTSSEQSSRGRGW